MTTNVDNEENQGLPEVYEFFTRYVRRIHPDTHWKRTMKINANIVFFQLITPSDIAFVILLKWYAGMEQEEDSVRKRTNEKDKSKTSVHVRRRPEEKLQKTTWSKEGLKYFRKVERTWQ